MTASKGPRTKKKAEDAESIPTVIAFKGFDKNLICNPTGDKPFQYVVGQTYTHEGNVVRCQSGGFHACEYPLDVFGYYEPGSSRFAVVEASGKIDRGDGDTKIASATLHIKAELFIPEIVTRAIAWVTALCKPADSSHATGYQSASSATGDRSASSATGDRSASSATGDRSASSATGYRSASSATGYRSASLTTGLYASSEVTKADSQSVAVGAGYQNKAKGAEGCAIVLCHRDDNYRIVHIRASKVGDNGIKPDVYYVLNANGEFQEAA